MGPRDTRLSVGDQAVTSATDLSFVPDSKGAKPNVADVNIDLTKFDTEVTQLRPSWVTTTILP